MRFDIWDTRAGAYNKGYVVDAENGDVARGIASARWDVEPQHLVAVPVADDTAQATTYSDIADRLHAIQSDLLKKMDAATAIDDKSALKIALNNVQAATLVIASRSHAIDVQIREDAWDAFERRVWDPQEYAKLHSQLM